MRKERFLAWACSGVAILVTALAVAGCEGVKQDLGIGTKRPPDEFVVYSRAPLSMPPDFALRPPSTPTPASQAALPRDIARQALLDGSGNPVSSTAASQSESVTPGMQALLDKTGASTANDEIRAQVNQESTVLADASQSFVERLMFWSDKESRTPIVDPQKESRRIQENMALNKPVTDGETPTIQRKPKALFEGIFN